MKLKLDENFGRSAAELLAAAGHEVTTVPGQRLAGTDDHRLIEVCRQERRGLVTMDLDFANPLLFRPSDYAGLAVIRLRARAGLAEQAGALRTLVAALQAASLDGKLWIVEVGRIREYQPQTEAGGPAS